MIALSEGGINITEGERPRQDDIHSLVDGGELNNGILVKELEVDVGHRNVCTGQIPSMPGMSESWDIMIHSTDAKSMKRASTPV